MAVAENLKTTSPFKIWLELAKSGIVTLVLISVLGGFLSSIPLDQPFGWKLLFITLFGILFLSAGSSALNQIQDQHMDAAMPRTQNRPLPSGKMSLPQAWTFVVVTIVLGMALLISISMLMALLGALAVFSYNGLYTLWWKRHWAFAAVPGAIPGALPALMGSVAASGTITPAGVYLFALLFFWQMPHFWVLAIRFADDYRAAHIPTLSVSRGIEVTQKQIFIWSLAYCGLAVIGPLFLQVGLVYLVMSLLTSFQVMREAWAYTHAPADQARSRWLKFFLWVNFSLVLLLAAAVIDRWSIYLMIAWV